MWILNEIDPIIEILLSPPLFSIFILMSLYIFIKFLSTELTGIVTTMKNYELSGFPTSKLFHWRGQHPVHHHASNPI